MNIRWITRHFEDLNSLELYKILQLRINVFMLEQNCLYPECDDKDLKGRHLYGLLDGEIVAYARLLPPHVSYPGDSSIGRVVVAESVRKHKIGNILMQRAIEQLIEEYPKNTIRISAQAHLKKFYNELGFIEEGEIYLEDNIPHIEMYYNNKKEE